MVPCETGAAGEPEGNLPEDALCQNNQELVLAISVGLLQAAYLCGEAWARFVSGYASWGCALAVR